MRVATWNINGLRARLEFLRLWLDARKPDIVGLQELKVTDDEFPNDVFEGLGYHAATYGQKAWNGVAVLSRQPLEVLDRGLVGEEEFGARLLRVRSGEIDFTTVYCPNGKDLGHDDFPKKLAWFDSLLRYWSSRDRNAPSVLCGDFNVVPAALDSWIGAAAEAEGALFHTKDERD
jgi:exodeoxyribonuclease III